MLSIPNRHKKAEKGCLRARIHYPALKFQQLAILTCAHGCVFSMHHPVSKIGRKSNHARRKSSKNRVKIASKSIKIT